MEPQTNMSQYSVAKLALFGIAMLVLSGAIGAILGPVFFTGHGTKAQTISIVSDRGDAPIEDTRAISGYVVSFSGNVIIVKLPNEIRSTSFTESNVIVTHDTKIIKTEPKDEKLLKSEMDAISNQLSDKKTETHLILQPELFTRAIAQASEIKIGDVVNVASLENISGKKVIVASEIMFHKPIK